jgi:hypothetical protein
MSDDPSTATDHSERKRSGLLNALLGAGVMIFAGWIPFVPVVGGALSGYLEAEEPDPERSAHSRGLRVGAIAGAIATIPALVFAFFVASIFFAGAFGVGIMGGDAAGPGIAVGFVFFIILAFGFLMAVAYHIVLGALGGWLGAEYAVNQQEKAAEETGVDDHPGRQSTIDDAADSSTENGADSSDDDVPDSVDDDVPDSADEDTPGSGDEEEADSGVEPEFRGGDDDDN